MRLTCLCISLPLSIFETLLQCMQPSCISQGAASRPASLCQACTGRTASCLHLSQVPCFLLGSWHGSLQTDSQVKEQAGSCRTVASPLVCTRLLACNWQVSEADLKDSERALGEFGGDNRAGVPETLHRISAIRNRKGKIVGLTCRVGRAVLGHIDMIKDILDGTCCGLMWQQLLCVTQLSGLYSPGWRGKLACTWQSLHWQPLYWKELQVSSQCCCASLVCRVMSTAASWRLSVLSSDVRPAALYLGRLEGCLCPLM